MQCKDFLNKVSPLQHTASLCNTLQYSVTYTAKNFSKISSLLNWPCNMKNTQQHTATHCSTLQHTATHCNTLQHTATHCNTLQHTATHCNKLHHTATHTAKNFSKVSLLLTWLRRRFLRISLQCIAVCYSVLQCVGRENFYQEGDSADSLQFSKVQPHGDFI